MKTIISASRRTDIPAFYLNWLKNHMNKGFINVPNPFNRKQLKYVSLSANEVGWIVLWSRNYGPFLKQYQFFQDFNLFFHFTVNPAHKLLEPDMISPAKAVTQMEKLVSLFDPKVIIWRYDPIVFYQSRSGVESNHDGNVLREYLEKFSALGLKRCYLSFVHLYPKVLKRVKRLKDFKFIELSIEKKNEILREMADLALHYDMQLFSCFNDKLLNVPGVQKGHCIDGKMLNQLINLPVSEKTLPTRPDCGCTVSIDIGDYVDTPCKYKCLYCYARR